MKLEQFWLSFREDNKARIEEIVEKTDWQFKLGERDLEFLENDGDRKVVVMGRRAGKTTLLALECLLHIEEKIKRKEPFEVYY